LVYVLFFSLLFMFLVTVLCFFCCLQLFKHYGTVGFFLGGSWNEVEVLPFSVGVLPPPSLSTLLYICSTLFCLPRRAKKGLLVLHYGGGIQSLKSIFWTLLFFRISVSFLSILPPFTPSPPLSLSLSLSLIYYPPPTLFSSPVFAP
jgi:hypothetical protein